MAAPERSDDARWPALALKAWADTYATLQLMLQIVGKIQLKQSAWMNHTWHCALYVTPVGLSTSPLFFDGCSFDIEFDFIAHALQIRTSDGGSKRLPLVPQTVAAFHARLMQALHELRVDVRIDRKPNEVADPIRFDLDDTHRSYDAEYVNRFWRILVQADRVLRVFRSDFIGKVSPVHFFWGAPDLAVTRFSGRAAPVHPGGVPHLPDAIVREAYSHEVSSCGFWPGGGPVPYAAFYSYAYPEPPGFASARVQPEEAFYSTDLKEFVLPYDAVRLSDSPDETLLSFLRTTYEAAADNGKWDRAALERRGSH